jgi:hypothetical protein
VGGGAAVLVWGVWVVVVVLVLVSGGGCGDESPRWGSAEQES